mmetsp:Transcript_18635/g.33356  ORF Transcript_18635/g.33356 Transcript_18635/m.33356 type:complete len:339 (-) Transcript_18635:1018-2034(-)
MGRERRVRCEARSEGVPSGTDGVVRLRSPRRGGRIRGSERRSRGDRVLWRRSRRPSRVGRTHAVVVVIRRGKGCSVEDIAGPAWSARRIVVSRRHGAIVVRRSHAARHWSSPTIVHTRRSATNERCLASDVAGPLLFRRPNFILLDHGTVLDGDDRPVRVQLHAVLGLHDVADAASMGLVLAFGDHHSLSQHASVVLALEPPLYREFPGLRSSSPRHGEGVLEGVRSCSELVSDQKALARQNHEDSAIRLLLFVVVQVQVRLENVFDFALGASELALDHVDRVFPADLVVVLVPSCAIPTVAFLAHVLQPCGGDFAADVHHLEAIVLHFNDDNEVSWT